MKHPFFWSIVSDETCLHRDISSNTSMHSRHAVQARAPSPQIWCSHPDQSELAERTLQVEQVTQEYRARSQLLHTAAIRQALFFPDRRLVQFDCGKLQVCSPSLLCASRYLQFLSMMQRMHLSLEAVSFWILGSINAASLEPNLAHACIMSLHQTCRVR